MVTILTILSILFEHLQPIQNVFLLMHILILETAKSHTERNLAHAMDAAALVVPKSSKYLEVRHNEPAHCTLTRNPRVVFPQFKPLFLFPTRSPRIIDARK